MESSLSVKSNSQFKIPRQEKLPYWFKKIQKNIGSLKLERNALAVFILTVLIVPLFKAVGLWVINGFIIFKSFQEKKWAPILLLFLLFELSVVDIFTDSSVYKTIRFPIMGILLIIGFFKTSRQHSKLINILIFAFLTTLIISIGNSQVVIISSLKTISFGLMSIGSLSLISYLRSSGLFNKVSTTINTFVVFNLILTIIVFPTDIAHVVVSLFNGSYGDPQSAGPFFSISVVWLINHYLTQKRKDRRVLFLAALALVFIYLTHSRTSMLTLGLGGITAFIISTLNYIPIPNRKRFWGMIGSVFFLFILGFATDPKGFTSAALQYIQKGDESTNTTELFQQTRGKLIEASMNNFYEYPIAGIGFGVATDYQNFGKRAQGALPTSASVEKGFLPSAVLEEQGLIGAAFLLIIIVHVTTTLIRKRSFMLLWLFFSTLFINIGEAALYSMGPLGLFMWIMIAYVYCYEPPKRKLLITNTA